MMPILRRNHEFTKVDLLFEELSRKNQHDKSQVRNEVAKRTPHLECGKKRHNSYPEKESRVHESGPSL